MLFHMFCFYYLFIYFFACGIYFYNNNYFFLYEGPGGNGVEDRQDDCQRRRSPVEPRQPRQIHQGTEAAAGFSVEMCVCV